MHTHLSSLGIKLKAGFYKAETQQMQTDEVEAEKAQRGDTGPGQRDAKKAAVKTTRHHFWLRASKVPTHCSVSSEKDCIGISRIRALLAHPHSLYNPLQLYEAMTQCFYI
ncbi:hypothetical protein STEG23_003773 [Scotinomys teguina]